MEKKPQIILVDHGFHRKTRSSNFFKEILKKQYKLEIIYDDTYIGKKPAFINNLYKKNIFAIIFWQIIPSAQIIRELPCKNIIWVPMTDSELNRGYLELISYLKQNVRIITFSKNLEKKYKLLGFSCLYLKYYLKPKVKRKSTLSEGIVLFFWNRTTNINWLTIKKLIGCEKLKKIYFKDDPDPGYKIILPPKDDIKKYGIEIIKGWISHKELVKKLSKTDIYIAPRLWEGIGLSFLEAMAMGIPTIAANNPVMNEYIADKHNGYLFSLTHLKPIDFSDLDIVKRNCLVDCQIGYDQWRQARLSLTEYITHIERPLLIRPSLLEYIKHIGKTSLMYKIIRKLKYYLA